MGSTPRASWCLTTPDRPPLIKIGAGSDLPLEHHYHHETIPQRMLPGAKTPGQAAHAHYILRAVPVTQLHGMWLPTSRC